VKSSAAVRIRGIGVGALIEQEAKALELVLDGGSGYWAASAAEPGAIDIGTELDEVAKLLQLACTRCLNESAGRGRIGRLALDGADCIAPKPHALSAALDLHGISVAIADVAEDRAEASVQVLARR
jgi:hypothetical protein